MNDTDQIEYQKVQDFLYNDDVQEILSSIRSSVRNLNLFEVVGLSNQEIKHSNTLAWLFGDNEHNLHDKFFVEFLKMSIKITQDHIQNNQYPYDANLIEKLRNYIYLPEHSRQLEIRREYRNIDILIVDSLNEVAVVIENKVDASESEEQLFKYLSIVNEEFPSFTKFFIFLTKDNSEPDEDNQCGNINRSNYLLCSYQEVFKVLSNILEGASNGKIELSLEVKMILDNYKDLLIRRNIVNNDMLDKLCSKIWSNPDYKKALEILISRKPNPNSSLIDNIIDADSELFRPSENTVSRKHFIPVFLDNHPYIKRLHQTVDPTRESGIWKERLLFFRIYISDNTLCWNLILSYSKDKALVEDFYNKIKDIKEIRKDLAGKEKSNVRLISKRKICSLESELVEIELEKALNTIKKISREILEKIEK